MFYIPLLNNIIHAVLPQTSANIQGINSQLLNRFDISHLVSTTTDTVISTQLFRKVITHIRFKQPTPRQPYYKGQPYIPSYSPFNKERNSPYYSLHFDSRTLANKWVRPVDPSPHCYKTPPHLASCSASLSPHM